jgi:hypothetical protein
MHTNIWTPLIFTVIFNVLKLFIYDYYCLNCSAGIVSYITSVCASVALYDVRILWPIQWLSNGITAMEDCSVTNN